VRFPESLPVRVALSHAVRTVGGQPGGGEAAFRVVLAFLEIRGEGRASREACGNCHAVLLVPWADSAKESDDCFLGVEGIIVVCGYSSILVEICA